MRQRTQTINALRGHLAEFGLVVPLGIHNAGRLEEAYAECEEFFPVLVPPAIRLLIERIHDLDAEIDEMDREIRRIVRGRRGAPAPDDDPGGGRAHGDGGPHLCATDGELPHGARLRGMGRAHAA